MERFVITFSKTGIRNGWVEVQAHDEAIAKRWANREYGVAWSNIYGWSHFFFDGEPSRLTELHDLYPLGCIGSEVLHYESAEHIR